MINKYDSKSYEYLKFVFIIFIITLTGIHSVSSQSWKTKPFSVGIFNNATLPFPESVTAVFNEPLHPGIEINYEFGWVESIKNPIFRSINTFDLGGKKVITGKWFQNISLSYYYHENINHAFALTTKGGYRRYLGKFSVEAAIHAGLLHTLELSERNYRTPDGTWKSETRPQRNYLITGIGTGIGYDAGYRYNVRRIYLNYDYRLQLPFSSAYVANLPNGILTLGLQFTLFKNIKLKDKSNKDRLECPE
ncbi:MAG: hypothetical protein K0B15_13505 [Lentimicrobium sp.]|nr:hypothetical protein [Lentimicrobium sp.]